MQKNLTGHISEELPKNVAKIMKMQVDAPAEVPQIALNYEQKVGINQAILQEMGLQVTPENRLRFALFWCFLENPTYPEIAKLVQENKIPFDRSKGILITGKTGIGKTCLVDWAMELCRRLYKSRVLKIDAQELRNNIADLAKRKKEYWQIIHKFGCKSFASMPHNTEVPDYSKPITAFLDDFGKEEMVNDFGTKVDVIKEILDSRHKLFLEHGVLTFGTSNLTLAQITERYGDRIESRLHQMFNVWNFTGRDLRKPEAK